jgi:hypothetical protein
MKKIISVFVAALIAAACTAPSTNQQVMAPANSNTAATKPASTITEADAMAKEKEVWAAFEKKDYASFAAMLADDTINVAPEAVYNKVESVKSVSGFVPSDVTFADWKFLPVDKDTGVIVYSVKFKGTVNGEPVPQQSVYSCTVWVNRAGKLLAAFHQGTEMPTTPPPSSASNKPKAAASPAPAPSPVATTADVTANEKIVWDALKARHYDVFASYLAPEFMEVEPNGVTDKAGSVKGVQNFDLSKSTLSDWKPLKLSDGAALVTYLVKIPGAKPDMERHSTIWANKSGKWMALLHQGTPVKAKATLTTKAASK